MVPPGERGREPPSSSSSSSLTFSLDGRRVSPLVLGSHGEREGREPLRDWIYLSVSAFSDSSPSLFLLYLEIRNSDWGESFAQIFLIKLAFLRQKKSVNHLTGEPRGSGARLGGRARPLPCDHLGHHFALILLPKNHKYSKKISARFYPIWTPFDIRFLRNKKHATDRNWHWALDQYVSPKK